ncbi:MAG TPA: cupin domain-containing protein [Dehalococcoidia bacterium]|nr:cupin domain-containing protein [Dehalococcoidia bacterium]
MTTAPEVVVDYHEGMKISPHFQWMHSTGLPIHRGYYIEDGRTVELGWWDERKCRSAFVILEGQEGVGEARITEIQAGETLPALKFALDEVVYVLQGRGLTTITDPAGQKKVFEWQPRSMFLLPRNQIHQLSNVQGNQSVRLLHYNFLPLAMGALPYPELFFNNDRLEPLAVADPQASPFSQAAEFPGSMGHTIWFGNFFPDLAAWDRLRGQRTRGAGSSGVMMQYPASPHFCHMSVFPSRTYKKAHRHGPGFMITIPAGEGYSVMWREGQENNKIVIPWHEGSIFIPPNKWFHQHFNVGEIRARYLAFHPPVQFAGYSEKLEDRSKDQIEYTAEDPFIRAKFEGELGKLGMSSLMPDEAYNNQNYEWTFQPNEA